MKSGHIRSDHEENGLDWRLMRDKAIYQQLQTGTAQKCPDGRNDGLLLTSLRPVAPNIFFQFALPLNLDYLIHFFRMSFRVLLDNLLISP